MEINVAHLGGVKFEVETRGHRLVCDQPRENGGEDAGMSPPELLLASLGSCAAYYAAQYLKTRALKVDNLNVRVTAEKAFHPARLGSFRIEVTAMGLDPQQEAGLMRSVKACLIHNTLLAAPQIEVAIETALPVATI
jgi:putative redox protein